MDDILRRLQRHSCGTKGKTGDLNSPPTISEMREYIRRNNIPVDMRRLKTRAQFCAAILGGDDEDDDDDDDDEDQLLRGCDRLDNAQIRQLIDKNGTGYRYATTTTKAELCRALNKRLVDKCAGLDQSGRQQLETTFAEFRPIRPDEIDGLWNLLKTIEICHGLVQSIHELKEYVRTYHTMVLMVQGRVYGFLVYRLLPTRYKNHVSYYVEARCSLAKAPAYGDNKPPVKVGKLMWTALVQILQTQHQDDLIAIYNYAESFAKRHHMQNCMQDIDPDDTESPLEATMVFYTKGKRVTGSSGERNCKVHAVPGAVLGADAVGHKLSWSWSCTRNQYAAWLQLL